MSYQQNLYYIIPKHSYTKNETLVDKLFPLTDEYGNEVNATAVDYGFQVGHWDEQLWLDSWIKEKVKENHGLIDTKIIEDLRDKCLLAFNAAWKSLKSPVPSPEDAIDDWYKECGGWWLGNGPPLPDETIQAIAKHFPGIISENPGKWNIVSLGRTYLILDKALKKFKDEDGRWEYRAG